MSDSKFNTNKIANSTDYQFLNSLDLDIDVQNRLSNILNRTVKGSEDVITTPIYNYLDQILAEVDKVLKANSHLLNDELIKIEVNQKTKMGPRSIAKPWSERKASLLKSFEPEPNIESSLIDFKFNNPRVLRPITFPKVLNYVKNSTNSGLPDLTKKGSVKNKDWNHYLNLLDRNDPAVLFTRTQEQGKTRDTWGICLATIVLESMYYFPLLAFQRKQSYRSALNGPDAVNLAITKLILDCSRDKNSSLYSLDFSAFDTTVKESLHKAVFNYIKGLFQENSQQDLELISNRFTNVGIVTPDGVLTGSHGVPSGSTFTNEVDSLAQYLILSKFNGIKSFQLQGDDAVVLAKSGILSNIAEHYNQYGPELNKSKVKVGKTSCIYLQNYYSLDFIKDGTIGGIYPIYRALNRLAYQERWATFEDNQILGKDYYSIRTLSILENCKHHPLFKEFVQIIFKYDKYLLQFSKSSLSKYLEFTDNRSGSAGIIQNQYSDNVRGIYNFESYKLVQSLIKS